MLLFTTGCMVVVGLFMHVFMKVLLFVDDHHGLNGRSGFV